LLNVLDDSFGITLDYRLFSRPGDRTDRDLIAATEGDLRYSHFTSDVVFRVCDADFSANWGWVPVLDLALGLESASDADRIQAIGAGTVQFGPTVGQSGGQVDQAFWAGRVSDGVSATRLMAVTSYVGNGAASRNITLDLSGASPVFAIVVPTNATAKAYRVTGDTTGRVTASGNALANSIIALGTDQITVGTALNANGVTYDVWAIRTGTVTP